MAFNEDLAVFINADTPGYTPAIVGGVSTGGIFDNSYSGAFDIDASGPTLILPGASAPLAAQGDAVVVGGISYTIADIRPDGTGISVLRLAEA